MLTPYELSERYIEIGYNIAYYRKHANLTQEQLAEMVDVSRQHIGSIEAPNITKPLSLDLLFNIADALDIDAYKLLQFKG